jgi:hypothetical protein
MACARGFANWEGLFALKIFHLTPTSPALFVIRKLGSTPCSRWQYRSRLDHCLPARAHAMRPYITWVVWLHFSRFFPAASSSNVIAMFGPAPQQRPLIASN